MNAPRKKIIGTALDMVSGTGEPILVALLSGHTISIGVDIEQPTNVPPMFVGEAIQLGAIPAAQARAMSEEERQELANNTRSDREALITKAIEAMVDEAANDPSLKEKLFTRQGLPDATVLSTRCGFQVLGGERNSLWEKLQGKADADDDSTDPD